MLGNISGQSGLGRQQCQNTAGLCGAWSAKRRPGVLLRPLAPPQTNLHNHPPSCAPPQFSGLEQNSNNSGSGNSHHSSSEPSIVPRPQVPLSFDAVVGSSGSAQPQHKYQQFQHAFASLTSDSLDSWDFDDLQQGLPGPSNTPTHEEGDGELLYAPRRDMWVLTDQPGIDLLMAGPGALEHLQQVYVILFGVGERETEGIYSLRAFGDDGLPQETIIVFETEEDAQRYAGLLEATMDHTPNVCSIPPRELLDFCVDQGYHCRMEPCGSLLIPPDFNVGVTDWERSMRLRDGRWAVLDTEPEHLASASAAAASTRSTPATGSSNAAQPPVQTGVSPASNLHHLPNTCPTGASVAHASLARYHPSFSHSQLQQIREKLESLLPQGRNSSE